MSTADKDSRKGGNMSDMGMTDKQFNGFLRFLIDSLTEVKEENDESKKNEKIEKIIENLQKTIEDIYLDATSSQAQYAAAIEQVKASKTSYNLAQEQFNLGMKNTVELLTEKNNFLSAQQEMLQAKYMAILNAQLLRFYQGKEITL